MIPAMTQRYEIRIRGHLTPAVAATFEGLQANLEPVETVLHGALADQAALYGVLDRLEALGLDLIEVRRMAEGGSQQIHPRRMTGGHPGGR